MRYILSLIIVLSVFFSAKSEVRISGYITDFDTKQAVSCAEIYISTDYIDTSLFTNDNGFFEIDNSIEESQEVHISFTHNNYYSHEINFVAYNDTVINFSVYNLESENYRIKNLAKTDYFDISMISIYYNSSPDFKTTFLSSFPLAFYTLDFKFKLADYNQLGIKASLLELQWYQLEDNISFSNNANVIKERYFISSGSYYLYDRFLITKTKDIGDRGLFVDIGIGYTLPYYSAYSYFIDKDNRFTNRRIYKFNDFKAMFRIGYNSISLYGSYRFNNVITSPYTQLPKFSFGIEFPMGI